MSQKHFTPVTLLGRMTVSLQQALEENEDKGSVILLSLYRFIKNGHPDRVMDQKGNTFIFIGVTSYTYNGPFNTIDTLTFNDTVYGHPANRK